MDSPVIDKGRLYHFVAAGLKEPRDGISEEIVANMSKVERFVGIRRGELNHDSLSCRRKLAKISVRGY